MIQDFSDHGAPKEPMSPLWTYQDSSVRLIHHDPSDLGSLNVIPIIPKKSTLSLLLEIMFHRIKNTLLNLLELGFSM